MIMDWTSEFVSQPQLNCLSKNCFGQVFVHSSKTLRHLYNQMINTESNHEAGSDFKQSCAITLTYTFLTSLHILRLQERVPALWTKHQLTQNNLSTHRPVVWSAIWDTVASYYNYVSDIVTTELLYLCSWPKCCKQHLKHHFSVCCIWTWRTSGPG